MKIILALYFSVFSLYSFGQELMKVEVLDKERRTFKSYNGESESVSFMLMRVTNETQKQSVMGVSVELNQVVKTEVMSSTGLTMTSGWGFALSSSDYDKIEEKGGKVFLKKAELTELVSFLSASIKNKSETPKHDIAWSINMENFALGFMYEKDTSQPWKYYMELNDGRFEIPFEDGVKLMKRLFDFAKAVEGEPKP